MSAYAQESITVADTAIGFTVATVLSTDPATPEQAVFVIETAQIRYRLDGGDPTTSVGLLGNVGDVVTVTGSHDVKNFRAIRTGATSATIQPHYFNKKTV